MLTSSSKNNVRNISDSELSNIKDKQILMIELEDINKAIQGKENVGSTLTILLFTGIAILSWDLLKGLILLSNSDERVTWSTVAFYLNNNLILLEIGFCILSAAVGVFLYMIYIDFKSRKKIIHRKNLILNEIKKLSRIRYTTKHRSE